ncbi:M48 family metallopeptidase, partial [Mangrovicoccus algicola]
MAAQGFYLDGEHAGRFEARLDAGDGDLVIRIDEGREVIRWPLPGIRALRDNAGADRLILRLPGADPRLVLEDPAAIRWALATCPRLGARVRDPSGTRRILIWAGGAAALLALLLWGAIPLLANRLAERLPPAAEARLGVAIRDQAALLFSPEPAGSRWCDARAGRAVLQVLTERLTAGATLPHPPVVSVLASPQANAFAAPGGQLVVLSGLIDAAETPEEVAAVLAHEIGHLAHRDPARLALRSAGTAAVLGLAVGDVIGAGAVAAAAASVMDARHSRAAEAAADEFALRRLRAAGISPAALAAFFDRLAAQEPAAEGRPAILRSHPGLAERSRAARQAAQSAPD